MYVRTGNSWTETQARQKMRSRRQISLPTFGSECQRAIPLADRRSADPWLMQRWTAIGWLAEGRGKWAPKLGISLMARPLIVCVLIPFATEAIDVKRLLSVCVIIRRWDYFLTGLIVRHMFLPCCCPHTANFTLVTSMCILWSHRTGRILLVIDTIIIKSTNTTSFQLIKTPLKSPEDLILYQ